MEVNDVVRVKSYQEIREAKSNLFFNTTMRMYCGREFVITKILPVNSSVVQSGVRGVVLGDIGEVKSNVKDWVWDFDKWLTPVINTNIEVTDTDLMELLNE